ncbi:MAG: hypothetical protein IJ766_09575 [Clostridia bacterium]|nr:hypothetical protein [Clostridia bacterium]
MNNIARELALIYTLTAFADHYSRRSDAEKNDITALTNRLACLYEEAYTALLLLHADTLDFSDINITE